MTDSTIIAGGGGDYTSITAWEADSDVTSGVWRGIVSDNSSYGAVTISGASGTLSATNYVELTTASGNAHEGLWSDSRARIVNTSNGTHCITIADDFTVINNVQIHQDSTGGSDEGIRLNSGVNDVLIDYCIIKHDNSTSDTDGIYAGNYAADVTVSNTIIYGFSRGGIHAQNFNGSATQTWNIDHCLLYDCGAIGEQESGCISMRTNAGNTVNMNIFNTACLDPVGGDAFSNFFNGGTNNWSGTNNACTDTSLTNRGITTGAQQSLTTSDTSQTSGSFYVVTDLTGGSEDFRLLDDEAGNLAIDNGVDRIGSEPDTRQDFSTSIEGNTRESSPDIGPSEFVAGGGGVTVPIFMHNYKQRRAA